MKYYIVSNDGFLKRYYSGQDENNTDNTQSSAKFSTTLRNAKVFNSIEEAKVVAIQKLIENCLIIDQNGIKQEF